jgi:hypothetical protein
MKALTLYEPWASLISIGAKTIETRSWSTSYRGPLAIHAAKRKPAPWWVHEAIERDPAQLRNSEPWFDELERFCHFDEMSDGWSAYTWARPLGAVVATCELVDVVPVEHLCLCADVGERGWAHQSVLPTFPLIDPDQLPYGDYTPGRFAWLLAEIHPVFSIPAKGKQGLWELSTM